MQDAPSGSLLSAAPVEAVPTTHGRDLISIIEHAKHYLPSQGPISIFVHHNTLHSFEDLPFEEAVIAGGARYGCEPYLSEERYHNELTRGRISIDDIRQVLMDDLDASADELIASFGTRYSLRLAMMQMTLHAAPDAELQWMLAETKLLKKFQSQVSLPRREQVIAATRSWIMRCRDTGKLPPVVESVIQNQPNKPLAAWSDDAWESFTLKLLWQVCHDGVEAANLPREYQRENESLQGLLLEVTGEDVNVTVNEILIRFCGSYLDQGFADWSLPERGSGFAKSFANLYLRRLAVLPSWMTHLRGELKRILDEPFDPLASIAESLAALGINDETDPETVEEEITSTMLALRGWAGMIWQTESNSPHLPHPIPSGSLTEYLAIRFLLQRHAIAELGQRRYRTRDMGEIRKEVNAELRRHIRRSGEKFVRRGPSTDERTYVIFQLAQAGGWTPEQLIGMSSAQWSRVVNEIESFDSLERRRMFHLAYERHYEVSALDAISIHSTRRRENADRFPRDPAYLAIFCIDDREESFRRHLEEIDPECRTASAAGFFAVAMYYRGADHAHYRPLCPAIVTPRHYVCEEPTFSAVNVSEKRAERRRRIGWFTHQVHAHSRTLVGGWFTGIFGAIATFPMVARIFSPRLTSRFRDAMGSFVRPPSTELHLERIASDPGQDFDALGYSLEEMADIVVRILQDIGCVKDFPPIVIFFGHGSGSLNNPHESAYNCGACSGGRGGPNARAFAMMANDRRVRRLTLQRGVEIPDDVRFVGAYHNTCSDDVEYYDLDLLPRTHRELFRRIEKSVNATRARNAHERARRFESAPLDLTFAEALDHVEQRAEDLSQARPEYNHATNAITTVGRRDWTRGLFLDRRAFLTEYDPSVDDENASVLTRILQAAIPVCAGISLEYYFSSVDVEGYGCGSKLPHNVASMLGVMTGAASDLRPGLSQQMIEIHEPMRMLFVIETVPETFENILAANPGIAKLVRGSWVHIALIDPQTSSILRYRNGRFEPYAPETTEIPTVDSSTDWYRGNRDHLGFASINEASEV
ncbi:DUF2309 domain-containing protein [Aporhodopirellula aestuarii]|uniref:Probable inorganic carbon transporter subunit DabA n=1 Tax=Aporhodopirellula aestuarii TaxID=2950107 RepID=A0ABT0TXP0_9BACT|nr:DUF2309 domain-containing protein [Aporhodopirellula aestuarii]MCM2369361.1 DUF2309 domain-containing protein [Aporhodopirellula aestuarii]